MEGSAQLSKIIILLQETLIDPFTEMFGKLRKLNHALSLTDHLDFGNHPEDIRQKKEFYLFLFFNQLKGVGERK